MELYSRVVVDHFMQPRCTAPLARADASGEARSEDPDCPDHVCVALQVEGGVIVAVQQVTEGCVATTAGASLLAERLARLTPAEARALTPDQLKAELGGLPSRHRFCLDVPLNALTRALDALDAR